MTTRKCHECCEPATTEDHGMGQAFCERCDRDNERAAELAVSPFKNRDGALQQAGAIMAHERDVTIAAMRGIGWKEPEVLIFMAVQETLDSLVRKNPSVEVKTQTVPDVTNLFFEEMARVRAAYGKAGITPADVGGA